MVLTNMVSINEADEELQSEVKDECDQFGVVEKVRSVLLFVAMHSLSDGHVEGLFFAHFLICGPRARCAVPHCRWWCTSKRRSRRSTYSCGSETKRPPAKRASR